MTGNSGYNSEYDAIGELFRRKLENHRMPVGGDGWDEISRRLGKRRKSRAAIWLWSAGAMAVAASIAALVVFNRPATGDGAVTTVAQHEIRQEPAPANVAQAEMTENTNVSQAVTAKPAKNSIASALHGTDTVNGADTVSGADTAEFAALPEPDDAESTATGAATPNSQLSTLNSQLSTPNSQLSTLNSQLSTLPEVAQTVKEMPKLDISLVEDKPDEEDAATESSKWLMAAALGTGGYTGGLGDGSDAAQSPQASAPSMEQGGIKGGNSYAADRASSIKSFNDMARSDFKNIRHGVPLSFGITARKSLGRHAGVESGLVYTYLSSRFEWAGYDVHQSLHYIGIPVNVAVYLWQSRPEWRIYLLGGVMAEKGLRGIYRQEYQTGNAIYATTVKSPVDGLQWSLNGALGVSYRFGNGFGVYFEPRAGYAFDCGQPVSVRTEWPVYIGINMGLNYEF